MSKPLQLPSFPWELDLRDYEVRWGGWWRFRRPAVTYSVRYWTQTGIRKSSLGLRLARDPIHRLTKAAKDE